MHNAVAAHSRRLLFCARCVQRAAPLLSRQRADGRRDSGCMPACSASASSSMNAADSGTSTSSSISGSSDPAEQQPAALAHDADGAPPAAGDARHMRRALELARAAFAAGEIPVGAVVVDEAGSIISEAHNQTEASRNPLGHAELLAIQAAAAAAGGWRLAGCTLYVTLEPCPMCAGAILNARLRRVCYGARSPRIGADGGWIQMLPPYLPAAAASTDAAGGEGEAQAAAAGRLRDGSSRDSSGGGSSQPSSNGSPGGGPAAADRTTYEQQRHAEAECTCEAQGPTAAAAQPGGVAERHSSKQQACVPAEAAIWPVGPHPFHPELQVARGVLGDECAELLREFFRKRRRETKEERQRLVMGLQQTGDGASESDGERGG